jgi:hypothetical protein
MGIINGDGVLPPGQTLEGTKQMFYLDTAPVGTEYADQAAPGALLTDTSTLDVYENQGTLAVPVWAQISTV